MNRVLPVVSTLILDGARLVNVVGRFLITVESNHCMPIRLPESLLWRRLDGSSMQHGRIKKKRVVVGTWRGPLCYAWLCGIDASLFCPTAVGE